MFNGRQGIPQFQIAAPTPDVSQTNAPSFDAFVKPSVKPAPPLTDRLVEARFEMHRAGVAQETLSQCDALIVEFSALSERVEEFLRASRSQHVATLEAKRADLWSKCREVENTLKSTMREIGRLNGQINSQSADVNAWRDKAADAARRPFETSFPTQEELDTWGTKRAAVGAELAKHEARLQEIRRESQFAEVARHEAAQQLATLVEQVRAVDGELNTSRKG